MDTRIVSSDSHVVEPPDLWQERVDSRYRDQAPKLVSGGEADWFEVGDVRVPLPS